MILKCLHKTRWTLEIFHDLVLDLLRVNLLPKLLLRDSNTEFRVSDWEMLIHQHQFVDIFLCDDACVFHEKLSRH